MWPYGAIQSMKFKCVWSTNAWSVFMKTTGLSMFSIITYKLHGDIDWRFQVRAFGWITPGS